MLERYVDFGQAAGRVEVVKLEAEGEREGIARLHFVGGGGGDSALIFYFATFGGLGRGAGVLIWERTGS